MQFSLLGLEFLLQLFLLLLMLLLDNHLCLSCFLLSLFTEKDKETVDFFSVIFVVTGHMGQRGDIRILRPFLWDKIKEKGQNCQKSTNLQKQPLHTWIKWCFFDSSGLWQLYLSDKNIILILSCLMFRDPKHAQWLWIPAFWKVSCLCFPPQAIHATTQFQDLVESDPLTKLLTIFVSLVWLAVQDERALQSDFDIFGNSIAKLCSCKNNATLWGPQIYIFPTEMVYKYNPPTWCGVFTWNDKVHKISAVSIET